MEEREMISSKTLFITFGLITILFLLYPKTAQSQWFQLGFPDKGFSLSSIYFINSNTGFVSGIKFNPVGGGIFRTSNGGNNWYQVLNAYFSASSYYFFNSQTGYAFGGFYATQCLIYKTIDGGLTWVDVSPGWSIQGAIQSVYFVNSATGYASGVFWIMKTTNSGLNWQTLYADTVTSHFSGIYFVNIQTGWCCRDSGRLYKTTNEGVNWVLVSSGTDRNLRKITFVTSNIGVIVGDSGLILRTTNGNNWTQVNSGTNRNLNSLFFTNITTGYASGGRGVIIKTTTTGQTWFSLTSGVTTDINSIYFIDTNTGYACGDSGIVLKTTNGGVIGIKLIASEIPLNYFLHQNYPNPFNPNTIINFQLSMFSYVKLIIYDVLGREVTTLVNEKLKPGTYESEWDGSTFSSGIYFYSLITDEFSQTRKMILLK